MRRFVLGWKKLGHEKRWKAYIVNYADDLVICCRAEAEQALAEMRMMISKLKLTVNETKTRVCYLPEEKFDFLGYTFGRCYSMRRRRLYLGTVPSKKRVQRICQAISDETGRDTVRLDPKTLVETLNRMLIGWANYFCLGAVSKAYSAVDMHARRRLRRWLCDKHNEPRPGYKRFPEASLQFCVRSGPIAIPYRESSVGESVSLFREPDARNLPVRFDEREQKTGPSQTGLRGRGESRVKYPPGDLSHCACSRLYSP